MDSAITLIKKINSAIINPIIVLLFAAAVIVFAYGVFEYIKDSDSDEARSTGRRHMISGGIGIFIMISVFGIIQIILNTIGASTSDSGVSNVINI